jgi:tRNA threonylcarbamoyl adenosine modification protein YeaZ
MPFNEELWLSVDLSSQSGSLAVHRSSGGSTRVLSTVTLPDGGKHSESVIPGLEEVLAQAGIVLSTIDRYITCTGPGSFTGLRIAFAALKAFHLANGKPLELVAGHEARALAFLDYQTTKPEVIWVSTQITRDSFLLTEFQTGANNMVVKVGDTIVPALPEIQHTLLTDRPAAVGIHFGLDAGHLAETLERCTSRETLHAVAAIAACAPSYFGSKNY